MNEKVYNKIFIWGTGHNANIFIEHFNLYYDSGMFRYVDMWKQKIIGFIDSDGNKVGVEYKGKMVFSFPDAMQKGMDSCIVTVKECGDIIDILKSSGFKDDQIIFWSDFLKIIKLDALKNRKDYLSQSKSHFDEYSRDSNKFIGYLSFSLLIDEIKEGKRSCNFLECYAPFYIADSIKWYFDGNLEEATEWINESHLIRKDIKYKKIHTIGIMVDRYYGGGIEKTTSLLIDVYLKLGFRVVLLTEEKDPDKEFYLPEEVTRCNFINNHDNVDGERYKELYEFICSNSIDIVLFHTGYSRLCTFYELLMVKLMGLPTIVEVRSAFVALIKDQMNISDQFRYTYLLADRVITLSVTDCFYWKCMGSKSICIPNPLEKTGTIKYTERRYKDDNRFIILWVGRIVQCPKQVFEVIPIMKTVSESDINAELWIIGAKDDMGIYENLKQLIEENGLKEFIRIFDYLPDIGDIYEEADVILLTSASESFSNVIVEAKTHSRPVVMYELPWLIPVQDGKGVIGVKQRDSLKAASTIISLAYDQELWRKYSIDAYDSACDLMMYDCVGEWRTLFEQIQEGVSYEARLPDGAENVVKMLSDQFYGKGYPYLYE